MPKSNYEQKHHSFGNVVGVLLQIVVRYHESRSQLFKLFERVDVI